MKFTAGGALLAAAAVVVVAAIVAGVVELGPPSQERARRLDTRRVSDLQQLSGAVEYYHRQKAHLPASLDDLSSLSSVSVPLRDPETDRPYGFRRVDDTSYEVCAVFDRDSRDERPAYRGGFWAHGAGTHCFAKKVPTTPQQ